MSRFVIHVDMNAYFASVEQKANPVLRGKPVVIVGDLYRRSVVMTASYEARAYGIKTGNLYWEAKKLCPQVIPVIGDPEKYLSQTKEIVAILDQFTDQLEMTSIDEGYLDVTGSLALFKTDGAGIAHMLQRRIKDELGLPCSVGVAPNKLLAKLASGMKKPMGITVIGQDRVKDVLADLPVEELCGIGPRLKEHLNRMGIKTCGQLGDAPLDQLQAKFGIWGYWMGRWGRGEDDNPVSRTGATEIIKSMGHSTTLPKNTTERRIIESFIFFLSEKVAARLRKGRFLGRTVTTIIRFSDFQTVTKSQTIDEPVDDGLLISQIALKIHDQLGPNRPIRLLGVSVSNLVPATSPPFLLEYLEKGRLMAKAMDEINDKFGRGTLRRAKVMDAEMFGVLEAPIPPQMHTFT